MNGSDVCTYGTIDSHMPWLTLGDKVRMGSAWGETADL